jgi:hypothetical protein
MAAPDLGASAACRDACAHNASCRTIPVGRLPDAVDELATAMADHYLAHPSLLPIPAGLQARTDSAIRYSLLTQHGQEQKPAWARLTALVEAHLRSAGIEMRRSKSGFMAGRDGVRRARCASR